MGTPITVGTKEALAGADYLYEAMEWVELDVSKASRTLGKGMLPENEGKTTDRMARTYVSDTIMVSSRVAKILQAREWWSVRHLFNFATQTVRPEVAGEPVLGRVAAQLAAQVGWSGLMAAAYRTHGVVQERDGEPLKFGEPVADTSFRRTYPSISKNVKVVRVFWRGEERTTTRWHTRCGLSRHGKLSNDESAWWGILEPSVPKETGWVKVLWDDWVDMNLPVVNGGLVLAASMCGGWCSSARVMAVAQGTGLVVEAWTGTPAVVVCAHGGPWSLCWKPEGNTKVIVVPK